MAAVALQNTTVDQLNKIIEVNEADMYITVEAGVTWKEIYAKYRYLI